MQFGTLGRVSMLLWVHECESIQIASHVGKKKAVEHSRTFSGSSVAIVKQLHKP